ncbi:MAG: MFS transporter [Spirochaetales bacterium]|nr:MFS transporter [Spirochaetales bacterium]
MKRLLNRELIVVIGVVGLAIMATNLIQPMLPLYLVSIGVNPTIIGLLLSVGMMGMVLGESSGGWLADRAGIRVPMFVGTFLSVPLVLSLVLARHAALIFVIFFFWGIVRASLFGPGRGYIGATISLSQKATFMAIYATAMAFFRSLGSFAGGFIVDISGYDSIFYTGAGIALAGGILACAGLKRKADVMPANVNLGPHDTGHKPVPLYRQRPFVIQSVIAALYFTALGVLPFLSLLAGQVIGLQATQVGFLFTLSALSGVVLLIPLGRLADRRNKKNMMALGLLTAAAGLAGISISTNFTQLAICQVIGSIGNAFYNPAAVALLSENVPLRRQSTAMGVFGGFEDTGLIIGSALGGLLWSHLGPAPTFLIAGTAPACLAAVITFVFLKKAGQAGSPAELAKGKPAAG